MTDIPPQAIAAAEADMLRRFPKADLHAPGTGFRWSDFLPALEAAAPHLAADVLARVEQGIIDGAGEVIAQAVAAERERCAQLLAAYRKLYEAWENGATVEIDLKGYNGISYGDTLALDEASDAIAGLLRQGGEGGGA